MTESTTFPCSYIADGYSRQETIEGDPDFHGPLKFSFRPMTQIERNPFFNQAFGLYDSKKHADLIEVENVIAEMMAKHIISWDLVDHEGNRIEISPESVQRLEPYLRAKLLRIVTGQRREKEEAADEKN